MLSSTSEETTSPPYPRTRVRTRRRASRFTVTLTAAWVMFLLSRIMALPAVIDADLLGDYLEHTVWQLPLVGLTAIMLLSAWRRGV